MAKKVRKVAFDPNVFLATIGGGRTLSNYKKDEVIFSQGKPADAVFYIQRGKVKITVVSQRGKEAIVAVLGQDEFCGEGCLAGQPRRMGTATAMTECQIMQVEKADSPGSSMRSRLSPKCSSHISWPALFELKRTWSISFSIRAKGAWHEPF